MQDGRDLRYARIRLLVVPRKVTSGAPARPEEDSKIRLQYSTVAQCSTAQNCAVQYGTLCGSAAQYNTVELSSVQCSIRYSMMHNNRVQRCARGVLHLLRCMAA